MTRAEAENVARLIGYADGGCSVCVRRLAEIANRTFPEWTFTSGDGVQNPDADDDADDFNPLGPDGWPAGCYVTVAVEVRS